MGFIRKLYNVLPRNCLIIIHESFIRPHLDYDAIIFDQQENVSFSKKIEAIQYNVSLAATEAIREVIPEKICVKNYFPNYFSEI